MPPISTLFASFRAYWVNWRGAVAWTIWRHIPRGKRTRSPCTSAPASRSSRRASSSPRNSMPTSSRIVSALCSMIERPFLAEDLERGERAGQEREPLDLVAEPDGAPALAAAGAAVAHVLAHRSSPGPVAAGVVAGAAARVGRGRGGRARRRAFGPGVATAVGGHRPGRQRHDPLQVRVRRRPVRDRHRLDEMLLEARLDRGLDLLDAAHDGLDLAPRGARQQRDQRTRAGGVAGRPDAGEVAVGDEAQDHRVERVDLAAERAGEPDLVDGLDLEVVHQQPDAGVERGLGELDGAHVVLGDEDARATVGRLVQDVAEGATVRHDARRARRASRHR